MECLSYGLGPQDKYLLDAASDDTFMRKYEDKAMELIDTMVENSHHNTTKPFGRGVIRRDSDRRKISRDEYVS